MPRLRISARLTMPVVALFFFSAPNAVYSQGQAIETSYELRTNLSTIRLAKRKIGEEKGIYHSLELAMNYSFVGKNKPAPDKVELELTSIVKAKRLKSDLYVVFVAGEKSFHFSSNRAAVKNPVPGRLWLGETMRFNVPYRDFLQLISSDKISIKMDGTIFELDAETLQSLKDFAKAIQPGEGATQVGVVSGFPRISQRPLWSFPLPGDYRDTHSRSAFALRLS